LAIPFLLPRAAENLSGRAYRPARERVNRRIGSPKNALNAFVSTRLKPYKRWDEGGRPKAGDNGEASGMGGTLLIGIAR
jgi:hypothetical protein